MGTQLIIVFDLDETLGYFVELGLFVDTLELFFNRKISDDELNELMDLFSEFIRPKMLNILNYLIIQKKQNKNLKIMIYTNNQGPNFWAFRIINYFENKLGNVIFEKIISAFKINGKRVEMGRTSHVKSYKDFINCTKLPNETKICFIDDTYYSKMEHENVYYINVRPYKNCLPFDEMASRYYDYKKIKIDRKLFISEMVKYMNEYNFIYEEQSIYEYKLNNIISKKIFYHIQNFINLKISEKTQSNRRKKRKIKKNRTQKKKH